MAKDELAQTASVAKDGLPPPVQGNLLHPVAKDVTANNVARPAIIGRNATKSVFGIENTDNDWYLPYFMLGIAYEEKKD